VHRIRPAATVGVERFRRGIELAHDEQRLAICLRQGDRGDGAVLSAFFVRPDDARWRCHFEVSAKAAGLGHWHPHELRHSAASLLLAQGVPLKVVSDILGHSSINITADIYAHILAPAKDDAATAMDRALTRTIPTNRQLPNPHAGGYDT
jgi:integrase